MSLQAVRVLPSSRSFRKAPPFVGDGGGHGMMASSTVPRGATSILAATIDERNVVRLPRELVPRSVASARRLAAEASTTRYAAPGRYGMLMRSDFMPPGYA